MAIHAIIPLKKLAVSKKRLATVFTPQERAKLSLVMLEDVLNALRTSLVDNIFVAAEDPQVKKIAEDVGAFYLFANGASLNLAIEEASSYCVKEGAKSILVLPADIPLINTEEINRIIELGDDGNSAVVLSPSHDWGTNALYQNPPELIPPCFGPESFINHIREAFRSDISVRVHISNQLATDIDSAEDLKKIFEVHNSTVTRQFLERIDFNPLNMGE